MRPDHQETQNCNRLFIIVSHLFVLALSALNAPTLNVIEYYEVGFEFNQNLTPFSALSITKVVMDNNLISQFVGAFLALSHKKGLVR